MTNVKRPVDTGTIVRTVLLIIALVNQIFGTATIALDEGQVVTIVEGIYLLGSTIFTSIISLVAWYKNNYVTENGKKQKIALQKQGLTKK